MLIILTYYGTVALKTTIAFYLYKMIRKKDLQFVYFSTKLKIIITEVIIHLTKIINIF